MVRWVAGISLGVGLGLVASGAGAQTGGIRGEVLDQGGQAVEGARVVFDKTAGPETGGGKTFELKTDKKGRYIRMNLPIGTYRITAEKAGVGAQAVEGIAVRAGNSPADAPTLKLDSSQAPSAGVDEKIQVEYKKAADLAQAGKLDEAEVAFQEILGKVPGQPQVLYNLGVIAWKRKDVAGAEAYYRQAIEARPDYADPYVGLSGLLMVSNQGAKAAELLTQGMAVLPDDPDLQYRMGWVLFNSGKSTDAEPYLVKAASLGSLNPEIDFLLGSIAVANNKLPEAVAYLEKYVAAGPTDQQNLATAQGLLSYLKPKK